MVQLLYWLTLGIAGAVVLVLAGYLIAVAWTLNRARGAVSELADALEEVAAATRPVDSGVDAVAGAVARIADAYEGVDRHVTRAGQAFG